MGTADTNRRSFLPSSLRELFVALFFHDERVVARFSFFVVMPGIEEKRYMRSAEAIDISYTAPPLMADEARLRFSCLFRSFSPLDSI